VLELLELGTRIEAELVREVPSGILVRL
jgi:hypothetical protein